MSTEIRVSAPAAHPTSPAAPAPAPVQYIGLITRGIAFGVDAAVINIVATIVGVGCALIFSLLRVPKDWHTALAAVGAAVYTLWTIGYFVAFWSATGQTPGARVMRFRVVTSKGGDLKLRRALIRYGGLWLAALPLLAGYLIIPFDPKRRGLQDRLAFTVVIDAPELPEIAAAVSVRGRRSAGRRGRY